MGTVFTIDIRDAGEWTDALREVVAWLHHVDVVFSTYRADSDLSRLVRGTATIGELDATVADVLELCVQAQRDTSGYFSPFPAGSLDPTGLVKGWAIERASDLLRGHASANHAVAGGGDIQLAGEAAPGEPWRVAIADPRNPAAVLGVVAGHDFAVATSGTAERGEHIVVPFTGRPARELASATVVGPRLSLADAYATGLFASGLGGLAWMRERAAYDALVVLPDGRRHKTSGLRLLPVGTN